MTRAIVFDVNETLLDLAPLDALFAGIFDDAAASREWFGQMLQSTFVTTIIGTYKPFGEIGMAALAMVATKRGRDVTDADRAALGETMRNLPPHPEVRGALEQLRAAGFRMATLTNSTAQVGDAQIVNAGLRDLFDLTLSADDVQRLKPAPEPYLMAAERLDVAPADLRLVAAHAWDVTGALNAGCAAAFIARPGRVLDPIGPQPDIVGKDLAEVVDQIIEIDG
jgi:2-haloacid dehalogenase